MLDVKVQGAAAKIDAVFRFNKELWRDVQRGTKEATDAITQDAQSRVPPMGLIPSTGGRGWGPWIEAGRDRNLSYNRGAFVFKTKFQSRVRGGFREVRGRSVLDISTPSVAIFTLAGSVDESKHPFNRNLNRQTGTRSGSRGQGMWPRLLTPAYHAKGPIAAQTIGALVEQAVSRLNRS